jgi:Limiting CO2-inducible proteins B/C beta carbonyic anhydrases
MSWETAMTREFPESIPQDRFVAGSYEALRKHGFLAENTIAFACVCRDEVTLPLVEDIENTWGEVFIFSSLGGMLILGKTGFLAAQQHAPIDERGIERYVYYALPHIAIGPHGEFGVYFRPGRQNASHACGALMAFQHELESRSLQLAPDPDDIEQSVLKRHLLGKLRYGDVPDLPSLTRIAHTVILEELERMIQLTVDPTRSDYGLFTGIQIHSPDGRHFVWPGAAYVVKDGKTVSLPAMTG